MLTQQVRARVTALIGLTVAAALPRLGLAQASQGPKLPTAVGVPNMFIFPENAFAKEGTCAGPAGPGGNCAGVPEGTLGDYGGFGFSIPAGAQILGIEVAIGGEGGEISDEPVLALLDEQGEPVGQAKSVSMPAGGYHEEVAGSPADTWGALWTPATINDPDFGVRVADVDPPGGFRLDYVAITVHYGTKGPEVAQKPRYSVAPEGPSGCDPADLLVLPGSGLPPCGGPGSAEVLIPCAALTFPGSCSGPAGAGPPLNDDVTALSFGHERATNQIFFSVDPAAQGCPGTAVESHQVAGHPQGDEFQVVPAGGACGDNTVFYTAGDLGLLENAPQVDVPIDDDDLDALAWPGKQPYFTLAPGSPTLAVLGAAPSDILTTPVLGQGPQVAVPHGALGLSAEDVVDALCMGPPGSDLVIFSLAPDSPSLLASGLSPGDLLIPGPTLLAPAASLGLLGEDDLDALKCAIDCNENGTPDSDDVAQGTAQDADSDGLLDECEEEPPPPPGFSACGTLVAIGGCLFLELPAGEIYHVQDTGGFQGGDQVLVEGSLDPTCSALAVLTCPIPAALAGCVGPNTIASCAPPPFTSCGTLVAFPGCVLFQASTGDLYQILGTGGFGPGDLVEVSGTILAACPSTCAAETPPTAGCIAPETIAPCPPPEPVFHRGDGDGNGQLELTDAVQILGYLFLG
ncbi:MAG: hypothetical protein HY721_16760, partial [Planctomycetes bacterium]|nr:hypothetical protein [Planctomycetota bacterium]